MQHGATCCWSCLICWYRWWSLTWLNQRSPSSCGRKARDFVEGVLKIKARKTRGNWNRCCMLKATGYCLYASLNSSCLEHVFLLSCLKWSPFWAHGAFHCTEALNEEAEDLQFHSWSSRACRFAPQSPQTETGREGNFVKVDKLQQVKGHVLSFSWHRTSWLTACQVSQCLCCVPIEHVQKKEFPGWGQGYRLKIGLVALKGKRQSILSETWYW